jgi:hypothetical protein
MAEPSYLVDTNILLRLVQPDSTKHTAIRQCTDLLWARGAHLYYTSQILAESGTFAPGRPIETAVDSQLWKPIDALERRQDGERLRNGRIFAVRNLLDLPEISKLAESVPVRELAQAVLGDSAFAVRGILFDKIPEANWKVPWHQDVTIAVRAREDVEGFRPWSTKAGILHVQPPAHVLEK